MNIIICTAAAFPGRPAFTATIVLFLLVWFCAPLIPASEDYLAQTEKMESQLETLKMRDQRLDTELAAELRLIEQFLMYEGQVLNMKAAMGSLTESEASLQLTAMSRKLFDDGTNDGDIPRQMVAYRETFETFLKFIEQKARTPAALAEIVRIRNEYVKQLADPETLARLLDSAVTVLGSAVPGWQKFADTKARASNALKAVYAEERTEFGLPPVTVMADWTEEAGLSSPGGGTAAALLSISLNDPDAGDGIIVLDPATGNRRRVYAGDISVMSWRPDGSSLHAWDAKRQACMLVKPDGSASPLKMRCIGRQSWNPDGSKFYFEEGNAFGGIMKIFESNPDGSGKRRLLSDEQNAGNPECSPDGHRLAFSFFGKKCMVCVMNVDGTGVRNVAEGRDPVWSPDGKRLAFKAELGSQETLSIAVANPDGADMRKILRQPRLSSVAWMPDGKRIVYTFKQQSGEKSINQFGIVGADGSGNRLLSKPDEDCEAVKVAPVGDAIAFSTSAIDNRLRGTWMITDSSGQRRALTDPTSIVCDWNASWSHPMSPATAAAWMAGAGPAGGGTTATVAISETVNIQSPTGAVAAFKRGMTFARAGRLGEAEQEFREAVRLDPANGEYQLWLGNACGNLQKWDAAEHAYRECIRLTPNNPQGHSGLAWTLAAREQWPECATAYREAIRLDPQNAMFHYYLGNTYGRQNKWPAAASEYNESVRLNPTNSVFQFGLGQALGSQGKWSEAQIAYAEAIRLEPKNAAIHDSLGNEYYNRNKFVEAEAQYREAISLNPANGGFHANLAGALLSQNRRDEAMLEAREAIRLGFRQHRVYGQLGINP